MINPFFLAIVLVLSFGSTAFAQARAVAPVNAGISANLSGVAARGAGISAAPVTLLPTVLPLIAGVLGVAPITRISDFAAAPAPIAALLAAESLTGVAAVSRDAPADHIAQPIAAVANEEALASLSRFGVAHDKTDNDQALRKVFDNARRANGDVLGVLAQSAVVDGSHLDRFGSKIVAQPPAVNASKQKFDYPLPTTHLGAAQAVAKTAAGESRVRLLGTRADFLKTSYVWRYFFFSPNRLLSGDLITVDVDLYGKAIVVEKLSALKWLVPAGIDLNSLKVSMPEAWRVASRSGLVFVAVSIDRDYEGRPVYRFIGNAPDYREILVNADTGAVDFNFRDRGITSQPSFVATDLKFSPAGNVGLEGVKPTDAELAYIAPVLNLLEFKIQDILDAKPTNQPTPQDFVESARVALAKLQEDRNYIGFPAPSDRAFDTLVSVVRDAIRMFEEIATHTSTIDDFRVAYEAYMVEIRFAINEGQSEGSLSKIEENVRTTVMAIIARINSGEQVDPSKNSDLDFFIATQFNWGDKTVELLKVRYPGGGASVEEEIAASKEAYAQIKSDWRKHAPSDKSFTAATSVVEKQIEFYDVAYAHLGQDELIKLMGTVGAGINDLVTKRMKEGAPVDVVAADLISYLNATIISIRTSTKKK